MTSARPFDVFFSYDHDDVEWMHRLRSALQERGIRVWVDAEEIRPAERWAERLENGLKSSQVYALIVTRRAMQSRWVLDEYLSALALANSGTGLQLLPLLMEDAQLPVFLSIRQYVDFRDPDRFAESLDQLCETLLASRPAEAGGVAPPQESEDDIPEPEGEETIQTELRYIDRALDREAQTIREMRIIQIAAVVLGAVAAGLLIGSRLFSGVGGLALAAGSPLFTGLIGWGATVRRLSAARSNENRLKLLREGLVVCLERRNNWCDRLQREFWRTVHGSFRAVTD